MKLDAVDKRLLAALQQDAHLTAEALSARLNLSPSQAGRRRQRLEAAGLIAGYTARLDPAHLGLSVQAFVQVQMATHNPKEVSTFVHVVAARTDIVSAWTLTGEADYLLRLRRRSPRPEHPYSPGSAAPPRRRAGAKPNRDGSIQS